MNVFYILYIYYIIYEYIIYNIYICITNIPIHVAVFLKTVNTKVYNPCLSPNIM